MASGNEMLSRLADLVPEYTNSGSEQTRALRHLNAEREKVEAELAAVSENYLLHSQTFPTVASRSPNRYSLPSDFKDIRFLERVVSDAAGDYEPIAPIDHLADKNERALEFIDAMVTSSSGSTGPPDGYFLGDDFIQLEPISDAVYTIRMWYTKRLAAIAASATELDEIPPPIVDALVYGAAVRELLYRKQDPEIFQRERDSALARGIQNLQFRVDDGPRMIRFVGDPGDYI